MRVTEEEARPSALVYHQRNNAAAMAAVRWSRSSAIQRAWTRPERKASERCSFAWVTIPQRRRSAGEVMDEADPCASFAGMLASGCVQGFGCRPWTAVQPASAAGVRKPPRNEPAGCWAPTVPRALWGFDGRERCQRGCVEAFGPADDAAGSHDQRGLLVKVTESCSSGLGSMMRRRICASVVAAGPQPALGEVVTVSSQDSDRGHDVSILMPVIGPVGR